MLLIALLLSFIGFVYFAITVQKQFQNFYGKKRQITPRQKWSLHGLAWLHILLALYPCILGWGAEIGTTVWVCVLHVAAFLLVGVITYWPKVFKNLWQICIPGKFAVEVFATED